MNRRDPMSPAARRLRLAALGGLLAGLLGCAEPQIRAQREEESDRERYPVKLVGDVSTFDNAAPIPVSGVALVEGLDGTGGPAPPGSARNQLEDDLKKQRVPNVKSVLASPDFALVLVSARVPPGARKGDRLDVEVALPPGSRTTSLRGGRLRRCYLYNYAALSQLSPSYANTGGALRGHAVARAEGPLLVGTAGGDEAERLKKGRIWGGAVSQIDRPFHIVMNAKQQYAKVSANVAARINASFQQGGAGSEVAVAKNNTAVVLALPPQYKHNPQRFLRVVRMVPLEDGAAPPLTLPSPPGGEGRVRGAARLPYRARLEEDLLDPARAVVAALRLEALGHESAAALKKGLQNPAPLVRFCAAEALAYLGEPACAEELARAVRQQPYLRAYALTALASLDESACRDRLFDLLGAEGDDETRYGAFRALRALDERDEAVQGELLGESFWLHRVAPGTKPLVHVALGRRPEVVLFGDGQKLVPPFSILAGEFTLTAAAGDVRCTVSRVDTSGDDPDVSRVRSALELAEVIKALASQGASYVEVLEVLRQADACSGLSCRVRQDALPQAVTVQQLAQAARGGATGPDAVTVVKPDAEMGATPELYQAATPRKRPATLDSDARALQHERRNKDEKRAAQRR